MSVSGKERIYGVIGWPVGHSLSPALHNWGFDRHGLHFSLYCRWPVTADKLGLFGRCMRLLPISGASVTLPHKETIIPFIDEISASARNIGAVNTLYWKQERLCGENTDVAGFTAPLRSAGADLNSALVLGAGGACRAIIHALQGLGVEIFLSNRNDEKGRLRSQETNIRYVPWAQRSKVQADLLVNTTPLGMQGPLEEQSPWEGSMRDFRAVYDIIYTPVWTPLLQQARREGKTTISGLGMFAGQGIEQFRLWTGLDLPYFETLNYLKGVQKFC